MTAALEGGEWSAARSGRTLPRERPGTHCKDAGWATGPVWTGAKSRPHRDSIPDRLARSQSLYRLSYPAHHKSPTLTFRTCEFCHTLYLRALYDAHNQYQLCHETSLIDRFV